MKRIILIFIILLAVLSTGCSRVETLISGDNSADSITTSIIDKEVQSENCVRLREDWSNWMDGTLNTSHGMSVNLFETVKDSKGERVLTSDTVIEGEVSLYLAYNLEVSDSVDKDNAKITALVLINDKLCDFALDDAKSNNGILSTEAAVNEDIISTLKVSDCNLNVGENKLSVILSAYYPQIGHSDAIQIIRQFKTTGSQKQTNIYPSADRFEDSISYTVDSDESVLNESSNYSFAQNRFDYGCSYINIGTDIGYRFINCDDSRENAVSRNVLCMAFVNGNPIELFNQNHYAILPLSRSDYAFDFPLIKLENKNEYTYISFLTVDLDEEGKENIAEHLFYTE